MSSALVSYDDSGSDSDDHDPEVEMKLPESMLQIVSAPQVYATMVRGSTFKNSERFIDVKNCKELQYNPKFNELYRPEFGPSNPHGQTIGKNFLTGSLEPAYMSEALFEYQRKNFHAYGIASDPSTGAKTDQTVSKPGSSKTIDDVKLSGEKKKRKRLVNDDPADIEGYKGPWAEYEDEQKIARPTEEEQQELIEILAKRKNVHAGGTVNKIEEEFKDRATLHIKDPYDYQGRSFLHPPHDIDGVPLHKPDHIPNRCFLPKKLLHTYVGHSKPINAIRLFPQAGHLLLSCSADSKIKLWELYNERRSIMTYHGHRQAVRDICFNRHGDRFISSGYDRAIKLWDTETGQCIRKFSNRKFAYCIRFNTSDESHSHYFLSGMSDKKILCWDCRSGSIVQEYDRHLGAVNTVTLVDGGRRFVSTSDDKSLRVWEWDIPVDVKYIADPSMHAIPAVTAAPNNKWLACQFMDNKIQAFACMNRFKLNQKKIFTGHMVAGYACSPDFSPDMSYLVSGDADGKLFFWDWKTTKLLTSFQAHENVCISTLWQPHETSKVITAGWDNLIKLWD